MLLVSDKCICSNTHDRGSCGVLLVSVTFIYVFIFSNTHDRASGVHVSRLYVVQIMDTGEAVIDDEDDE